MPMDGKDRAGLDGVEHALGLVGRGVPEVAVHSKARGGLGLGGQIIKQ